MSIKVMTMVFDRYPTGGNERLLALAMADHARDDGTSIWPSIDELSRKTLQSRSTVQRQIAKMLEGGWLQRVSDRTGRGHTNEYRISPSWIAGGTIEVRGGEVTDAEPQVPAEQVIHKGVNLTPFSKHRKGVNTDVKGVNTDVKGVTAMTPESSEPSEPNTPLPPDGGAIGFERIFRAYPNKANRAKAERRWVRLRPDVVLCRAMLAAIEAQASTPKWRKDGGQFVPELATWLRNRCWLDDAGPTVVGDWWADGDGIKAMGIRLGMPYSLSPLGNAYTDDQLAQHWRSYRGAVLKAAGDGPRSGRHAA